MDYKIARQNMVQQQIRPWGVLDPKVLELLSSLPRERFVLEPFRHLAYSDTALPITQNQLMLQPKIVGRILQTLRLTKDDSVLEIGTGTGYLTAALARLAKKVVTIEQLPDVSNLARANLSALDIDNVQFEIGNGLQGFPALAPFDVIVLTGSVPHFPRALIDQLEIRGRLFAIIGVEPVMSAVLLTKITKEQWNKYSLFETLIPPLEDAPQRETFRF